MTDTDRADELGPGPGSGPGAGSGPGPGSGPEAGPGPGPGSGPGPGPGSGPEAGPGPDLDERDRAILDFERDWWRYAGAKEQAIRERFDVSPTRYYQLLNRLIDDDTALAHDPMLVKRLRRMRASRRRQRAARRLGVDTSS